MVCSVAQSYLTAYQASLSFSISQSLLKLISIELVMPSNHLIPCRPLLLLPSIFPSIRVFSNELDLHIKWPNIGASASASVLLVNIHDGFTLGFNGLIFLQSRGLSAVFSNTMIWKNQFKLAISLLYGPALTSIHDYWKDHSFYYTDLCR